MAALFGPSIAVERGGWATYLEILDEVVHDTQAFWVLAVLHIDERSDLGGLQRARRHVSKAVQTSAFSSLSSWVWSWDAYFERNVVVAQTHFEFLATGRVFLGPFGVVFAHDLAILDDTSQLSNHGWRDPHCSNGKQKGFSQVRGRDCAGVSGGLTLFADEAVVAVVRVVGIAQTATRVFELEKLVSVSTLVPRAEATKSGQCQQMQR